MEKTSIQTLHFENFETGQIFEAGGMSVSQSQIVDFALAYDPQPFSIDAVAADKSDFGGLVASGYMVIALANRLFHETGILRGSQLGLTGIEDVHFLKPVRPEDRLTLRVEVIEVTPAKARADRGFVRFRFTLNNQSREVVMTLTANHIVARKPTS